MSSKPTVFFHGKDNIWTKGRAGRLDCINLVQAVVQENGFTPEWVTLDSQTQGLIDATASDLHLILDDKPMKGENVIFCVPSYLNGFWFFDRKGTRNNSSMAAKVFNPDEINRGFSRKVFENLNSRFVALNFSKFTQEVDPTLEPLDGSICIFAQDFKEPRYHQHYMSYPELISEVIKHRGARHVYIKPHPRQTFSELETLMGFHNPSHGVTVTNQSIHHLLPHASVAVSLSSAVLMEAQLHKVPGVVAGQVDFSHNLVVARSKPDVSSALHQAWTRKFEFEKFMVFYFTHGMVQPKLKQKARARMQKVLSEMGFGA